MNKILIFGGTTEARQIGEFLDTNNLPYTISVATEYGREVNHQSENLLVKRLDLNEMIALMISEDYELIIDATHPYALEVSENICKACQKTGKKSIRVIRKLSKEDGAMVFPSHEETVEYLNNTTGNILLTIGSKEMSHYTKIEDYQNRIYARILPIQESIEICHKLGIKNTNLICMQGPFSKELNQELLKHINAQFIVSKNSGEKGRIQDKIDAALELNITPVIITRQEEAGFTLAETFAYLTTAYDLAHPRFPLFVDLWGAKILVIGGGNIAYRRVLKLLPFGPKITILSPTVKEELEKLIEKHSIQWIPRTYEKGSLSGYQLIIGATNQRRVNHCIYEESKDKQILASIADCKEESSFWFPALVNWDDINIGLISTKGDHKKVKSAAEILRNLAGENFEP